MQDFYSTQLPVTAFRRPPVSAWAVHTTDPSVEGKSAIHLLEKSAVPVEISASAWHSFQKHNPHKLIRLHMSVYVSQNKKTKKKQNNCDCFDFLFFNSFHMKLVEIHLSTL